MKEFSKQAEKLLIEVDAIIRSETIEERFNESQAKDEAWGRYNVMMILVKKFFRLLYLSDLLVPPFLFRFSYCLQVEEKIVKLYKIICSDST